MAQEANLNCTTFITGADLHTDQYHFVDINGDGHAVLASEGGRVIGVLQDKPAASGDRAQVALLGSISKVVVGTGGLTAGGTVASDSTGQAITPDSGDAIVGICLVSKGLAAEEDDFAAGDLAPIFLSFLGTA